MYCTCVGQCQEDSQTQRRGRICVCRMLCHWRSPHRLTLLSTLPSLSSATHSPPALDQLLPMQRFCDGTLSNHWMGCLRVSLLQVVFCVQRSLCTQLLAHSVRSGMSHSILRLMSDGACMAVGASSGCRRYTLGFTASLLREKHIYEEMSVKGEQGGSGGGVRDERETGGEM